MAKTSETALLEDIADSFHTYLKKGVHVDRVVGAAHPELDIDDIETLLRIHFVLTDAEATESRDTVGVLDFMRELESRLRRMKTTTSQTSVEQRGEIRGRIDWHETVKRRMRAGRLDEPLFVCNQPEEHYTVDENRVLKRLLQTIYEIVYDDLQPALEDPDGYDWLDPWLTPSSDGDTRTAEATADRLKRLFERNVYLQRIELEDEPLTDRTIESVKRSRSRLYREAALLLDRYRQLMNRQLDSTEARDLLNNTILAPEKTEVLFELYWIFRILDSYEGVEYHVLTGWADSSSTIATWEHEGSEFVLSHDSTGEGLKFEESLADADVPSEGYLARMHEVLKRWQCLSSVMLDRQSNPSFWGGRPDIVLERFEQGESTDRQLADVFIGEVKYSRDIDYISSGLRELLEYMAFARHGGDSDNDYVEENDEALESESVKGLLFVDTLTQETTSPDEIEILQYPESVEQVL